MRPVELACARLAHDDRKGRKLGLARGWGTGRGTIGIRDVTLSLYKSSHSGPRYAPQKKYKKVLDALKI